MKRPDNLINILDVYTNVRLSAGDASKLREWINHLESQLQPRKTVSDAVDYFDGVWPDIIEMPDADGWWFNGEREMCWASYTNGAWSLDVVCTREEFEAEVERRKGDEWTHGIPPNNVYCYVNHEGEFINCYLIGRDDMGAFIYRVDGQYYQTALETNFRPIKPTISKAEAWDMIEGVNGSPNYIKERYEVK